MPLLACARPPDVTPLVERAFDRPAETAVGERLALRLAEHPGESAIYVLGSGLDAFAARMLLIGEAERAVDVQYYIFHDDVTGRLLLSRLIAAADRGVRVRLLLDDLGSPGIDRLISAAAAHENLEVRLFNALARGPSRGLARVLDLLSRPRQLNHRMHNKMLSADGALAVVGGRNVGDEYFDAAPGVNFADLDLLVAGPVLPELGNSFDLYWNSPFVTPLSGWPAMRAGAEQLDALRLELAEHDRAQVESEYAERVRSSNIVRELESGQLAAFWAPTHAYSDLPEKIVAKGEELEKTLLARQLGPLFEDVSSELLVVSPYFIPREAGVAYFKKTVDRGVRVRILTNSLAATDVPAVHAGYSRYRKDLLRAGVELYELKPTGEVHRSAQRRGLLGSSSASLHAKTFVVDGDEVFVGSLNLDPRSVSLNTELGLVVEGEELASRQIDSFERIVSPELSWRVQLDEQGRRDRLVWEGTEAGVPERHAKDPDTSWWARFKVSLLKLLPIEGQL
jgi:putative cardiolipin synthase